MPKDVSSNTNMSNLTYKELVDENKKLKKEIEQLSKENQILREEDVSSFEIGNAVSDGISVIRADGVVEKVNKAYTEITGISEEEIIGKRIQDMVKENYFSNAVSPKVLESGEKIEGISHLMKNNKTVLLVGMPIFDEEGKVSKALVVMRNLTELINLKERLEQAEEGNSSKEQGIVFMKNKYSESSLIGESEAILRIKELINYVAPTEATVLITGETGSGKEVVSKEVVRLSKRKDEAFVKINCAAIPEPLLESELFGYVKGAFTGADNKDKKGLFETAHRGTILLDEISEMPINLQSKLLRAIQEKEITPVGGVNSIKVDTRIIAACNKNLEELVEQEKFRADLYYRLNVFPVRIPSLRERHIDIINIAKEFLVRFNKIYDKNKEFDSTAETALMEYSWPGNVRELENITERMVILCFNKILTKEDVDMIISMEKNGEGKGRLDKSCESKEAEYNSLKEAVNSCEKRLIEKALIETGSTYGAAKLLKTTQPTIVRKAQKLGIRVKKEE